MTVPAVFPWARSPSGPAPLRRAGSVRRTSTIDTSWPDGFGSPMRLRGVARDIYTPDEKGDVRPIARQGFDMLVSPQREILSLATDPDLASAETLVGVRAGGASRRALAAVLGEMRGQPLYQLIDDFAGASLVAGWVWSLWTADWTALRAESKKKRGGASDMTGVCTGFAPGSSALAKDGMADPETQSSTLVGPLIDPADPAGWHEIAEQSGPEMRRARRIDLWREDGAIRVEAFFQDSGSAPGGTRVAIHEYLLSARVRPTDMTLVSVTADPRILPFRECPGAALNIAAMVGKPVSEFREQVPAELPGTLGCTHLNDVMRALADVPALALNLPD